MLPGLGTSHISFRPTPGLFLRSPDLVIAGFGRRRSRAGQGRTKPEQSLDQACIGYGRTDHRLPLNRPRKSTRLGVPHCPKQPQSPSLVPRWSRASFCKTSPTELPVRRSASLSIIRLHVSTGVIQRGPESDVRSSEKLAGSARKHGRHTEELERRCTRQKRLRGNSGWLCVPGKANDGSQGSRTNDLAFKRRFLRMFTRRLDNNGR